ncbi:hypothetical protein MNV49_006285 [Pseudohyphozyma bogoriensis]|nr:hypothetical protein MNV49_006285 [Pseudohyphozyma bogoriensis]
MDWSNTSVAANFSIALTKLKATNTPYLGSLFVNPGGPGGSGTAAVYTAGAELSLLVNGQYDIVGWDPRGVNLTTPGVNCFTSALADYTFELGGGASSGLLDLPSNLSSAPNKIRGDLLGQLRRKIASYKALGQLCEKESGEMLAYVGTANVVKDLDYISQKLDGPNGRINLYALSYGTVIGQYLAVMLPASRIGRVILDGVVDAATWSSYSSARLFAPGVSDVDKIFKKFAQSCIASGPSCALSSLRTASRIESSILTLIDTLYASPAAAPSTAAPGGIVTAEFARYTLYQGLYSSASWPLLAEAFAYALEGNYVGLLTAAPQLSTTYTQAAKTSDAQAYASWAIACADSKPYNKRHPAPPVNKVTDLIWSTLLNQSSVAGEAQFPFGLCDQFPVASKSYYSGSLTLAKNTLDTPILLLSNSLDPATPLSGALAAYKNLGLTNARVVEQNGTSHTTFAQPSTCVAMMVAEFYLAGTVPSAGHSHCVVETLPFQ